MWQTATLETEIAARDFRHDAPGIALGIRGSSTETGPWRGKLLKCRGILWRRKSRRFTRTSWWSRGDSNRWPSRCGEISSWIAAWGFARPLKAASAEDLPSPAASRYRGRGTDLRRYLSLRSCRRKEAKAKANANANANAENTGIARPRHPEELPEKGGQRLLESPTEVPRR